MAISENIGLPKGETESTSGVVIVTHRSELVKSDNSVLSPGCLSRHSPLPLPLFPIPVPPWPRRCPSPSLKPTCPLSRCTAAAPPLPSPSFSLFSVLFLSFFLVSPRRPARALLPFIISHLFVLHSQFAGLLLCSPILFSF